ncbi:MAG: tRNA (adenosine(37)-N6)-dimethylallyltransferase MiaA [Actinomycetales bacterium]|nr:tRNA (adenosine(37)-N6)-dimethylallyltransferase MiaA [Actinomycetales bacterium]
MTLIFIVGATATGKSDLAIKVAQKLQGEVVNADSMQLYKGMDVGTAKLSKNERQGIEHYLIDILEVTEDSSAAQYQALARAKIDELLLKGIPTIVVGGTGLYVKSILDDLNFPDTNEEVRARLQRECESIGALALHAKLAKLDPAAAAAIPAQNSRRVIRALEVIELTGRPFTANLPRQGSSRYPDAKQFGLVMDREKLSDVISNRVERMWEKGFVAEVRELLAKGLREGKTARAALGYSQIIRFLDGELSEIEAQEDTKRATRQYSRRQETWFSRDNRITWLKGSTEERLEKILSTTISNR